MVLTKQFKRQLRDVMNHKRGELPTQAELEELVIGTPWEKNIERVKQYLVKWRRTVPKWSHLHDHDGGDASTGGAADMDTDDEDADENYDEVAAMNGDDVLEEEDIDGVDDGAELDPETEPMDLATTGWVVEADGRVTEVPESELPEPPPLDDPFACNPVFVRMDAAGDVKVAYEQVEFGTIHAMSMDAFIRMRHEQGRHFDLRVHPDVRIYNFLDQSSVLDGLRSLAECHGEGCWCGGSGPFLGEALEAEGAEDAEPGEEVDALAGGFGW